MKRLFLIVILNQEKEMYRNSLFFELQDFDLENPDTVSMTVPGMAMDLRTLMQKHMAGQEIPVHSPIWAPHNIPDLATMSKIERAEYAFRLRNVITDYQQRLQEAEAQRQADEKERIVNQLKDLETQVLQANQKTPVDGAVESGILP